MLKILISAYACEPNKGSEPEVGWKITNALATLGHKVYVITKSNNKENIENYLKYKKAKNITFLYFDIPKWIIKILRKKNDLLIMPSLRDTGGFVILEAMNNVLPVATLNIGGPAKIVDNSSGIKINVKDLTQEQIVNNLSNKISYLIKNPKMYKSKVKKSLLNVKNFYLSKKVNFIYENFKINEIK